MGQAAADERLDDHGREKLLGLLRAGDPKGEVATAWHAKEAVRELYGHTDAELALTLEELAARVGSRAEVWVRLGRARISTLAPVEDVRDAFVRALAVAESGSEARRDALLALANRRE